MTTSHRCVNALALKWLVKEGGESTPLGTFFGYIITNDIPEMYNFWFCFQSRSFFVCGPRYRFWLDQYYYRKEDLT